MSFAHAQDDPIVGNKIYSRYWHKTSKQTKKAHYLYQSTSVRKVWKINY